MGTYSRHEVFNAQRVRWISAPSSMPLFPVCISMVARVWSLFLDSGLVVWLVDWRSGFVGAGDVLEVGEVGGESSVLLVLRIWNPVWVVWCGVLLLLLLTSLLILILLWLLL